MNKIFMGLLAVAAIALVVSQAIAGASNSGSNAANAANNADNGGVMIIETYSASAVTVPGNNNSGNANANNNGDMQPLPGDPGVEVAPTNTPDGQPVVVEEDMLIQQTEDGE